MPKLISLRVVIAASVEVPSIEACKRLQAIIRSAGVVAVLLPEGDNPVDLVEAPTIWFESAHVRHGSEMLPYKPNMPRDVSVRKKKRSKYNDLFDIYERTGRPLTIGEMIEIAGQNGIYFDRGNMRSQVFLQKKIGRANQDEKGYLWGFLKDQPKEENNGQ